MTRREQAVQLIEEDIRRVYTEYYPIHDIIEQTGSLKFAAFVQTGMIIYESRDETHFIRPTEKVCDLLRPMQYQYVVGRYNRADMNLGRDFYGTEVECRAWVTRQQAQLYKFDAAQYHRLKGQLIKYEDQLKDLYKDAQDDNAEDKQEILEINNYLQLVMREVRVKIERPLDKDLPEVSLEEAVSKAEGTRE